MEKAMEKNVHSVYATFGTLAEAGRDEKLTPELTWCPK